VRWGGELLLTGLYASGGAGMLVFAIRRKLRFMALLPGFFLSAAGIVFHENGMASTYILLVLGICVAAFGIWHVIQHSTFTTHQPGNF
jgi:hypothetical protein